MLRIFTKNSKLLFDLNGVISCSDFNFSVNKIGFFKIVSVDNDIFNFHIPFSEIKKENGTDFNDIDELVTLLSSYAKQSGTASGGGGNSGGLTDAQLRASAVLVSQEDIFTVQSTVEATDPEKPLTNAELREFPVEVAVVVEDSLPVNIVVADQPAIPVAYEVNHPLNPITNEQLRQEPLPVSTGSPTVQNAGKVVSVNQTTASTVAILIKNTGGVVSGWNLHSRVATWGYIKLYDSAIALAVGQVAVQPKLTIPIPPNNIAVNSVVGGIAFPNGIFMTVTANQQVADATVIPINGCIGSVFYK